MKRFTSFLLALTIIVGQISIVFADTKEAKLDISSKSAVLMDASTGKILYEKNSHEKLPPASVTKVMTMLLICEALESGKIKEDDDVQISEVASSMGGSQIFLEPGEIQKVDTLLKLQGGSKSAIEIATQAVRKCGTVVLVGVYGARYNMFPLGDFFARNITLKMGQCPAQRYVDPILKLIKQGEFDATDIITHKLKLDEGKHAYEIFDKKLEDCIKVILKP